MRLSRALNEYLMGRDFHNTFEVANTIADYKEGQHKDIREIPNEIWELATRYVKKNKLEANDEFYD